MPTAHRVHTNPVSTPQKNDHWTKKVQETFSSFENGEKLALQKLKILFPLKTEKEIGDIWKSFNMSGEMRQRLVFELAGEGSIPLWAETHKTASMDVNNLHRFDHIRSITDSMIAQLQRGNKINPQHSAVFYFSPQFLADYAQISGYQTNDKGALFRTDMSGVFRGDHRTPDELTMDGKMLAFNGGHSDQHTTETTLCTSTDYRDGVDYGHTHVGEAGQFNYGYQDAESPDPSDSDSIDSQPSERLREHQTDGFVYSIDTRGLEAVPIADNLVLNPHKSVEAGGVIPAEVHISALSGTGITSDRIWLVNSLGTKAVKIDALYKHFPQQLSDLNSRTLNGEKSYIYDALFDDAALKGIAVLDISEMTRSGATQNIRDYQHPDYSRVDAGITLSSIVVPTASTSVKLPTSQAVQRSEAHSKRHSSHELINVTIDDFLDKLVNYFLKIKKSIDNHIQMGAFDALTWDKKFLTPIVALANEKKPGLDLFLCDNPDDFVKKIKTLVGSNHQNQEKTARFIVPSDNGGHFAAFDCRVTTENKISIIGVDSSSKMGAGILTMQLLKILSTKLPNASFKMMLTFLQSSHGECAIFSLALAKKMFEEQTIFQELHEKNLAGQLVSVADPSSPYLEPKDSYRYLPATMMKHFQSQRELNEYLAQNPKARDLIINNKRQTLATRLQQHRTFTSSHGPEGGVITCSNSIELERKKIILSLITELLSNPEDTSKKIQPSQAIPHLGSEEEIKEISFAFDQHKDFIEVLGDLIPDNLKGSLSKAFSRQVMLETLIRGPNGVKEFRTWLEILVDDYLVYKDLTEYLDIDRYLTPKDQYRRHHRGIIITHLGLLQSENTEMWREKFDSSGLRIANSHFTQDPADDVLNVIKRANYKNFMDQLRTLTENSYIFIDAITSDTKNYGASAITVDEEGGKKIWSYFDPDSGYQVFAHYDDFRQFMDHHFTGIDQRTLSIHFQNFRGVEGEGQSPPDDLPAQYESGSSKQLEYNDKIHVIKDAIQRRLPIYMAKNVTATITSYSEPVEDNDNNKIIPSVTVDVEVRGSAPEIQTKVVTVVIPAGDIEEIQKALKSNRDKIVKFEGHTLTMTEVDTWNPLNITPMPDGGESDYSLQLIMQLENDLASRQAATALASKHARGTVVFQLDKQGGSRNVYGENELTIPPREAKKQLRVQFPMHGNHGEYQQYLAGQTPAELAKNFAVFMRKLRQQYPHLPEIDHISLVACEAVTPDKRSGLLWQFADELIKQGITHKTISAYSTKIGVSPLSTEEQTISPGRKITPLSKFEGYYYHHDSRFKATLEWDSVQRKHILLHPAKEKVWQLIYWMTGEQAVTSLGQPGSSERKVSQRIEAHRVAWNEKMQRAQQWLDMHPELENSPLSQVAEQVSASESLLSSPTITPYDEVLIKQTDRARTVMEVQRLEQAVSNEIDRQEKMLTRQEGKAYRFKRLGATEEGKTSLIFVPVEEEPEGELKQEKRLTEKTRLSESDVFTHMRNKMAEVEPGIAETEGISTMNFAFLAMHLFSQQHQSYLSPWKQFVGNANFIQILHGVAQDIGNIVKTVKILSGVGTQAEGMLSKLLGGTGVVHTGSIVSVAVDIINLVNAIDMLESMPPGAKKDIAIARVALASTQLAVDSSFAVLGVVATFSPAVASAMAFAGPLAVPFAGLMIGANALLEAMEHNHEHHQVELDQLLAPFRHAMSKTALTPTGIAKIDHNNPHVVALEPYVPLKRILIKGNNLSVQVSDIGIPHFYAESGLREHTSDYGSSLSAYTAFGFDMTKCYLQSVALPSSSTLVLPAALDGYYDFSHDVQISGELDGVDTFNTFYAHYGDKFFNIEHHWDGYHGPNSVKFYPRDTAYVITLDSGTRRIVFQDTSEVKKIPGQNHDGLTNTDIPTPYTMKFYPDTPVYGHLPTPMTDRAHAKLLTYTFQGGGGTTSIDLPDDSRHITLESSTERVKRENESWVLDITPDRLADLLDYQKAWLVLQQRVGQRIPFKALLSELRKMGLDEKSMETVRETLIRDYADHGKAVVLYGKTHALTKARTDELALWSDLERIREQINSSHPSFWKELWGRLKIGAREAYEVLAGDMREQWNYVDYELLHSRVQRVNTITEAELQTSVLGDYEFAVSDIVALATPWVTATQEKNKTAIIALQQAHTDQLAWNKSVEHGYLQLGNRRIEIKNGSPGAIMLTMRPVELPGVTFHLSERGTLTAPTAEKPTKFLLKVTLDSDDLNALSDENLANIQTVVQQYFNSDKFTLHGQSDNGLSDVYLRSVMLSGVVFKLRSVSVKEKAPVASAALPDEVKHSSPRQASTVTQKFAVTVAAESLTALSSTSLAEIQRIMQSTFSNKKRFIVDPQIPISAQVAEGELATGVLNLATQRWQAVSTHTNAEGVLVPMLHTSDGGVVTFPACTTAQVAYDPGKAQLYVESISTEPHGVIKKLRARYDYDGPEGHRYQHIEIYLHNQYMEREAIGASPSHSRKEGDRIRLPESELMAFINDPSQHLLWVSALQELTVPDFWSSDTRLKIKFNGLAADFIFNDEYITSANRREWDPNKDVVLFKKAQWDSKTSGHRFILSRDGQNNMLTIIAGNTSQTGTVTSFDVSSISRDIPSEVLGSLSSLTLSVGNNTNTVDLSAFPTIPFTVFAQAGTDIVGARPDTTVFLHAQGLSHVTFKLSALPRVPGEMTPRWTLAGLNIDDRMALREDNLIKIVGTLRHQATGKTPFQLKPTVPLYINSHNGEQATGSFDTSRQRWLAMSRPIIGAQTQSLPTLYSSEGDNFTLLTDSNQIGYGHDGLYVKSEVTLMRNSAKEPLVQLSYRYSPYLREGERYRQLIVRLGDSDHYRTEASDQRSLLQQFREGNSGASPPLNRVVA